MDRRKYPRVGTGLPVSIEGTGGRTWPGKSINLSLGGLKVQSHAPLRPGDRVRLRFTLPDGEPGTSAVAMINREDSNGLAFVFVEVERSAFDRIRSFVNYLLPRQPLKVLVIEDDQTVAEVFSDFIRDEGTRWSLPRAPRRDLSSSSASNFHGNQRVLSGDPKTEQTVLSSMRFS
ncbi:MAG: PilZ domain-containing protein [Candidatus Rokubacteria bacterium]|nr:PilZ domain-containing protein [Candidatus Rokubacteria bacterium]